MCSLRKSFISLCLVGSTIGGLTAFHTAPAQAAPAKESKASQCKRLEQATREYGNSLSSVKDNRSDDLVRRIDRVLAQSEAGLKRLQARKFADPKIRQFQQGILDYGVAVHNDLLQMANAIELRDRDGVQQAYQSMLSIMGPANQLDQTIKAYCGSNFNLK